MTQEDIISMAREAGFEVNEDGEVLENSHFFQTNKVERFAAFVAAIVAAAEREKVAHWMHGLGYATGHGDTIEDLLDHLGTQIAEGLLTEREACAKVCEDTTAAWTQPVYNGACMDCAAAIRARGNK
jgi:hypothetical protein